MKNNKEENITIFISRRFRILVWIEALVSFTRKAFCYTFEKSPLVEFVIDIYFFSLGLFIKVDNAVLFNVKGNVIAGVRRCFSAGRGALTDPRIWPIHWLERLCDCEETLFLGNKLCYDIDFCLLWLILLCQITVVKKAHKSTYSQIGRLARRHNVAHILHQTSISNDMTDYLPLKKIPVTCQY